MQEYAEICRNCLPMTSAKFPYSVLLKNMVHIRRYAEILPNMQKLPPDDVTCTLSTVKTLDFNHLLASVNTESMKEGVNEIRKFVR